MQRGERRGCPREAPLTVGAEEGLQSPYPQPILIYIAVQPVVDHHVPSAVVVGEGCGVPPVLGKGRGQSGQGGGCQGPVSSQAQLLSFPLLLPAPVPMVSHKG